MDKAKPMYSIRSNLRYVMGNMYRANPWMTVFLFVRSPFIVIVPFLGVWMSRTVVAAISESGSVEAVLYTIGWVSLALLAAGFARSMLQARMSAFQQLHDFDYQVIAFSKAFNSDYEIMESPSGLTRLSKAMECTGSDSSPTRTVPEQLSSIFGNLLGIVSYAVILWVLSPWILAAVSVTTLAGFFVLKISADWTYRNKDQWKTADRKLDYLFQNAADFTRAKDMRLYSLYGWFGDVFSSVLKERKSWVKKEAYVNFRADLLRAILSVLREGIAYGFLVYLLYNRNMSAADFVLYFGIIGGFAGFLESIVFGFDRLNRVHLAFCEFREFVDYPDKSNRGQGVPLPTETFSIEFKNVCFRYPGSDQDTIKSLSFTISKGEKLAIVGLNGAGKTTLVKLMCGLYSPTSGEILVNDTPIGAYNLEEYYKLFSAVFQDIYLLPRSIACNVSAKPEIDIDRNKTAHVLTLAGLDEKIASLSEGMDTKLVKSVYNDAVDFSGGEMQKLALARALYKDGLALVLDEPTAALDPIAESRIYEEYNRMTAQRTSVFISHRLASTRFCDRILFLDDGVIVESGSHDDLMEQGGKYHEMFEIQSHYYKEEVEAV